MGDLRKVQNLAGKEVRVYKYDGARLYPTRWLDTIPPSVPSFLSSSTTSTTVTAQWTAVSDNVMTTGYELRAVYGSETKSVTTTGTTGTITGLPSLTLLKIAVRARDAVGNWSNWSPETNIATAAATPRPPLISYDCTEYISGTFFNNVNPGSRDIPSGTLGAGASRWTGEPFDTSALASTATSKTSFATSTLWTGGSFSLAFWGFVPTGISNAYPTVGLFQGNNTCIFGISMKVNATTSTFTASPTESRSTTGSTANAWNHYALAYNDETKVATAYINGNLAATWTITTPVRTHATFGVFWRGAGVGMRVDDIRVWDVGLTSTEVTYFRDRISQPATPF